jgi:heme a synthase
LSLALSSALRRTVPSERPIAFWLLVCCAMIFLMVVIGGITRLSEAGLSITEWRPVTGVLPPLDQAQWMAEFDKYKAIPQYRAIHGDMTLDAFKVIFFWEYLHRLWGRLIGVVFAAPFLYFLLRGRISRQLAPRLLGFFALGALQGLLGWYMVESGLADRIEVSQYRLAAHLALAVLIYGATLWMALDLLSPGTAIAHERWRRGLRAAAAAIVALAFLTMIAGAFVAGLRAGYLDNTFPLMEGAFAPPDYWLLSPPVLNWFENPTAVQFDHRLLAESLWLAVAGFWTYGRRAALPARARVALHALFALATIQAGLGIATLLLVVPLPLAVAHQAGALLLLTAALTLCHQLRFAVSALDASAAQAL